MIHIWYLHGHTSFDLQSQLGVFPEELNIYTVKTLSNFQRYQRQLPVLDLYPKSTFLSIYRKEIDPILKELVQVEFDWFKKQMDILLNAIQFAVFTNQNQSDKTIINEVIQKALFSTNETLTEYELTLSRFDISINKILAMRSYWLMRSGWGISFLLSVLTPGLVKISFPYYRLSMIW